uniref:Cytohesin 2 n=1 Tax=Chinchilla lanigera TaxID=34839 RepID=A0A8C2V0K8_CHILA
GRLGSERRVFSALRTGAEEAAVAPGAFERAHPSPRASADPGPTGGTAPDSPRAFLAAMEEPPDLTPEERMELENIRRRKQELLVEIQRLREELSEAMSEVEGLEANEGRASSFWWTMSCCRTRPRRSPASCTRVRG